MWSSIQTFFCGTLPTTLSNKAPDIIHHLEDNGFKAILIKRINDSVDIPMINEETEAFVLERLYDIIKSTIVDAN